LRASQREAHGLAPKNGKVNDNDGKLLDIELVLPLGGGACGLLPSGRGWVEAILHDLSPQFTEPLRVGWLAAWKLTGDRRSGAKLLLAAASEVDWLSNDPITEAALDEWLENAAVKSGPLHKENREGMR
jgi:hypothetical protein